MAGSESMAVPLPTTPGQAALWSLGIIACQESSSGGPTSTIPCAGVHLDGELRFLLRNILGMFKSNL